MSCREIYQFINVRQGKVVLRTGPVQISEVYTDPISAVFLRHRNNVGQPSRVFRLLQEACINLIGDLFLDLNCLIRADPSEFLFDRAGLGSKRDPVLYNLRFDSRHGFVGPRENIFEIF